MSAYKGNSDECPHGCGLTYGKLRTGLRYYDVFVMLMDYSSDSADWKYKRRRTVLGKWHQIKKSMWDYHCDEGGCPKDPRNLAAESGGAIAQTIEALNDAVEACGEDEVPF